MNILVQPPGLSLENTGDEAMMLTLEHHLTKRNMKYSIFTNTKENRNSLDISNYDMFIWFGVDVFAYYSVSHVKDIISNFIKNNKKVLIFNLSWGYDANNGNYLKSISNNKNIYFACRDHYSYNILNETYTFANKPYLTSDIVFAINKININKELFSNELTTLMSNLKKINNKIIVINIHEDFNENNKNVLDKINSFIEKNNEYTFIFLGHVRNKKEVDYMKNSIKKTSNMFFPDYLSTEEELYLFDNINIECVITGRMHLAILSLVSKIYTICISYNGIKSIGTFNHFDLERCVISPDNMDLIEEQFSEQNIQLGRRKINENYDTVIKKSLILYDIISEHLI